MTPSRGAGQAGSNLTQNWKQWEGQVVGGEFHLRQYLGGREHSAVFLTEDPKHGLEKAAIKLIPAAPRDAELQISRWKAAAKLSHPQLIRLFQMGRCRLGKRNLLYVVMEHAEVDLSQILQSGPLPPKEIRETLRLILNTLAYLHGKGFVHGHLKPANLMGIDNQLKLSSDGLCEIGESSSDRGKPGVYDPPEAASGTYSPAGDVWSLGITLVEALTQHPPALPGTKDGELLLPQSLPSPFLDIARNCLRRAPERRWTVGEIATHLEPPVPAPAPAVASPKPHVRARPQMDSAKRRYIVAAVGAGLALLLLLTGLSKLNHHHAAPVSHQNTVTRQAEPPAQKVGGEQQTFSGTQPSRPSVQSMSGAHAPAGVAVQAEVLQKVLPNVPQSALDTIQGTVVVTVKVAVDPSGNMTNATLDSAGPSKYFARLALEAARKWKFRPAEVDGRRVSSERVLEFSFERTGTQAVPMQAATSP